MSAWKDIFPKENRYFETDKGILYNIDTLTILKNFPKKLIDLIIIDPPYNIGIVDWDNLDNFEEFTESYVKYCSEIIKENGSLYGFMSWHNVCKFKQILDKYFYIKNWITWERTKGRNSSTNFKQLKEEILYYTKHKKNYTWNEQKMLRKHVFPYKDKQGNPRGWFIDEEGNRVRWTGIGNVWHYTVPFWNMPEYTKHPTQKPELMLERIILSSSNENDLILDPFSGSGTSLIVAEKLNRRWIGIEISEEYCEITKQRIENYYNNIKGRLF